MFSPIHAHIAATYAVVAIPALGPLAVCAAAPTWQVHELTSGNVSDVSPAVSGTTYVWKRGTGNFGQILMWSEGDEAPVIISEDTKEFSPRIDSGRVLWESSAHSDYEIIEWKDGVVSALTNNTENDRFPDVGGFGAIWRRNSWYLIYDNGKNQIEITSGLSGDDQNPRVVDDMVVWEVSPNDSSNSDYEVFLWQAGILTQLTNNDHDDRLPETDGTTVVWQASTGPSGTNEILRWTASDGITPITNNAIFEAQPDVSGDAVVFIRDDGNDFEIFLNYAGVDYQLTTNDYNDFEPAIDGDRVVWYADIGGGVRHIYYAILDGLSGGDPPGACCDGLDCTRITETDCFDAGGSFNGPETFCELHSCPEAVRPADTWSTYQHDAQRTGRTSAVIPDEPVRIWSLLLPGGGGSIPRIQPVVGPDGTVFAKGGELAINREGSFLWQQAGFSRLEGSPTVRQDGNLWVGGTVINSETGEWLCGTGSENDHSNALTPDGDCYSSFFGVRRIGSDCESLWAYTGDALTSHVALGLDGGVYASTAFALNRFDPATGNLDWSFATDGRAGAPAIGVDGAIHLHVAPNFLVTINPDGSERWSRSFIGVRNPTAAPSPAIGRDGAIYFVSNTVGILGNEPVLVAVSLAGEEQWRVTEPGASEIVAPVIDGAGRILFPVEHGGVIALHSVDGTELWRVDVGDGDFVNTSPTIADDGTVYVTTDRGFLIAFGEGCPEQTVINPPYSFRRVVAEDDTVDGHRILNINRVDIGPDGRVTAEVMSSSNVTSGLIEQPDGTLEIITRGTVLDELVIDAASMPRRDDHGKTYMHVIAAGEGPVVLVDGQPFLWEGVPRTVQVAPTVIHEIVSGFFDVSSDGRPMLLGRIEENDPLGILYVDPVNGQVERSLSVGIEFADFTVESIEVDSRDERHRVGNQETFVVRGEGREAVTLDQQPHIQNGDSVDGDVLDAFSAPQIVGILPVFIGEHAGGNGLYKRPFRIVGTGDTVDSYLVDRIEAHSSVDAASAFTATLGDGRVGVFRGGLALAVEQVAGVDAINADIVRQNQGGDVAFVASTNGGPPSAVVVSGPNDAIQLRTAATVGDVLGGLTFDFDGGHVHCPREDADNNRYQSVPVVGGIQTILLNDRAIVQEDAPGAFAKLRLAETDPALFNIGNGGHVVVAGRIDVEDPFSVIRVDTVQRTMQSVVRVGETLGGFGTIDEIHFSPADTGHVNDQGDIAFVVSSTIEGAQAVVGTGAPHAKSGDVRGGYTLLSFDQPQVNDAHTIDYWASTLHPDEGAGEAVFIHPDTRVVGSGTRFGGIVFGSWSSNGIQQHGVNASGVAVTTGFSGDEGILFRGGVPLLRSGVEIDGVAVDWFDRPQIRDNGEVVFLGHYGAYQTAWFTETERLVGTGDTLSEGTIGALDTGSINNAGQLAYSVIFAEDDRRAIYIDDQPVVIQGVTLLDGASPAFVRLTTIRLNDAGQTAFVARDVSSTESVYVATPTATPEAPYQYRRVISTGDVINGWSVGRINTTRLMASGLTGILIRSGNSSVAVLETAEGVFETWGPGDTLSGLVIERVYNAPHEDIDGNRYHIVRVAELGDVVLVNGLPIIQQESSTVLAPVVVRIFISSFDYTALGGKFTALAQFEFQEPFNWVLIDSGSGTVTTLMVPGQEFERRELLHIDRFVLGQDDTIAHISRLSEKGTPRALLVDQELILIENESVIDGHTVRALNPMALRYNSAGDLALLVELDGLPESLVVGTRDDPLSDPMGYVFRRAAWRGEMLDGVPVGDVVDFRLSDSGLVRFVTGGEHVAQFIELSPGEFEAIEDGHTIDGVEVISIEDLRLDHAGRVSFRSTGMPGQTALFRELTPGTFRTWVDGGTIADLPLNFAIAQPFAPRVTASESEVHFAPIDPVGPTVFAGKSPLVHARYEPPPDGTVYLNEFIEQGYLDHDDSGKFTVYGRADADDPAGLYSVNTVTGAITSLISVGTTVDGFQVDGIIPAQRDGIGDDGGLLFVGSVGQHALMTPDTVFARTGDVIEGHMIASIGSPRRRANGQAYYLSNGTLFSHTPNSGVGAVVLAPGAVVANQPLIETKSFAIAGESAIASALELLGSTAVVSGTEPVVVTSLTQIDGRDVVSIGLKEEQIAINALGQIAFLAIVKNEPWALYVASPTVTFDHNADGEIDVSDYDVFEDCLTGPGTFVTSECAIFDANNDCKIDLDDYALFQGVFGATP